MSETGPEARTAEGNPVIERPLCDLAPGERGEFVRFDAALEASLRDRLIAYGISPGQSIDVVQQRPLTIVVCDHAELAVEAAVAQAMIVRRNVVHQTAA